MGVDRRLLALSFPMPPLVFPRALQISRGLKALTARGWTTDVVTAMPDAVAEGLQDAALGALYDGQYNPIYIEPREARQPSSPWRRAVRAFNKPANLDEDNWLHRAEAALLSRLRTGRYDALATFAQPWINHSIGLAVHRKMGSVPWVAHFSDPWVDSPYYLDPAALPPGRFEFWKQQERAVAEQADALVFVTRGTAELVMRKYPSAWSDKVHVMPHGYDRDLIGLLSPPARNPAKLKIVHTGSLYAELRMPTALLEAVAEINAVTPLQDIFEIDFLGYRPQEAVDMAARLGLDGFVRFHGQTGYIVCLEAAASADMVLLIDAPLENSVFLPSKIVDYLMLRKPILGMTPATGESAKVLAECGHPIVSPTDKDGVKRLLEAALDRHRRGEPLGSDGGAAAEAFDIRQVIESFEAALGAAIAAKQCQ